MSCSPDITIFYNVEKEGCRVDCGKGGEREGGGGRRDKEGWKREDPGDISWMKLHVGVLKVMVVPTSIASGQGQA